MSNQVFATVISQPTTPKNRRESSKLGPHFSSLNQAVNIFVTFNYWTVSLPSLVSF